TLHAPLHWRKPRTVFVCSMTDLFGEWVPEEWIAAVWAVMESAPQHTFQVLTKRPNRAKAILTENFYAGAVRVAGYDVLGSAYGGLNPAWPLPNVWLGVTVESDAYAWRARVLAEIPAAVRFVSAEPLLGPPDNLPMRWLRCCACDIRWPHSGNVYAANSTVCPQCKCSLELLFDKELLFHWLLVGGESGGPLERRLVPSSGQSVAWVQNLRNRARSNGVAFFFKQWGGATPKGGGRLLDGRTGDEMPRPCVAVPA